MRKQLLTLTLFGLLLLPATKGFSQTVAMDFQGLDCNGNMQHLFSDLDAGNAVIIEFFMQSCSPCITAGTKLEAMKSDLLAEFPGMIKAYAIGFNNTNSCASIANWVNNNSFTSIPMDSGAAQVAYYGGMGMPTIVILGGGSAHSLLASPYVGFSTSDTITMAAAIRDFLGTATTVEAPTQGAVTVFPNPSEGRINLSISLATSADLSVDVMDLAGKQVLHLLDETAAAGSLKRSFDVSKLQAGMYLLRVSANGSLSTTKFNIVR